MLDWFEAVSDLDKPIVIYPRAIRAFGGHAEAAFVYQFRFWMKICADKEGHWVYKTTAELEEELCLTVRQQEYIREKLTNLGVLETEYRRTEHLLYFRLKRDVFNALMEAVPKNAYAPEHSQKEEVAFPKNAGGIPKKRVSINTEITTESTAESTAPSAHLCPTCNKPTEQVKGSLQKLCRCSGKPKATRRNGFSGSRPAPVVFKTSLERRREEDEQRRESNNAAARRVMERLSAQDSKIS
jgi:hypothetical protein